MSTEIATVNPDRIKAFLDNQDARQSLLTAITHLYKTLTHHFSSLDQSLSQKAQTLDSQIQALDSRTQKTLDSLQNREDAIPDRLSAASTRVEGRKEAAISAAAAGGGERRGVREYCRVMDWKGLLGFVIGKKGEAVGDRGEGTALREEIAAALAEETVDGMRMVLDVLEDFVDSRVEGRRLVAVADRRWAVGVLIQAVVETGGGGGEDGIGRGVKERAVGVLEKWKGAMGRENSGFGSGEARMFLQIVIGFGLKEMVGEEYLRKLLVQFTTKRQIGQFAKLAMTLGLPYQIKDIPVESAKSQKNASKSGRYSTAAVEEANNLEKDEKLESKSTIDNLWKRVKQLEKTKEEPNKNSARKSTGRPPNKRGQRGGGGPPSYLPKSRRFSDASHKSGRFSNASPASWSLHPSHASFHSPYNYAGHNMYEGPGSASYGPGYGGAAGTQVSGSYSGALLGSYSGAPAGGSYGGDPVGGLYGGQGGQGSYGGQRNFGSYGHSAAPPRVPAYPPYHH